MNDNNNQKTNQMLISRMEEKYMKVLHLDLEDYTPDDKRVLFLFWLGFLLAFVKKQPVENIIEIMAEEYFENHDVFPEHIELKEVKKYKICDEYIYGFCFCIQNGFSFINKFFSDDAVLLPLKDGSGRYACEVKSDNYLKVYLNEEKMNELFGYLNTSHISNQNKLRDVLVKFYSLYHIHLPSFHAYLSRNNGIDISRLNDFEDLILKFKTVTSDMIYFWAKDLIRDGHSVKTICKSLNLKNIDADTIKKFITYLFELKFIKVREIIKKVLDESANIEHIRLPLAQYPSDGKYAYNNFPSFSKNGFVSTGKHVFIRTKPTYGISSEIGTLKRKKEAPEKAVIKKQNDASLPQSRTMYVDLSFSMGDLFQNFLKAFLNREFQKVLNKMMNNEKIFENTSDDVMFFNSNFYYSVLRLKFENLSGDLKLCDIIKHQKFALHIPILLYIGNDDNVSVCEPLCYNCSFTYKFDEELLNTPVSDFLHPENISVFVDLVIEKNSNCIEPGRLLMKIEKRK